MCVGSPTAGAWSSFQRRPDDEFETDRGGEAGTALRVTWLTAPGVFDGAIDGESFRAYIDQILGPTLQPDAIVIADNLGAHKVAGATLWYLPP